MMNTMISIQFGGAAGFSAIVTRMAHATVSAETEKALRLTADNGASIWVPRKGLVSKGEYFTLAPWFRKSMSADQWRWFERNESINGLGA